MKHRIYIPKRSQRIASHLFSRVFVFYFCQTNQRTQTAWQVAYRLCQEAGEKLELAIEDTKPPSQVMVKLIGSGAIWKEIYSILGRNITSNSLNCLFQNVTHVTMGDIVCVRLTNIPEPLKKCRGARNEFRTYFLNLLRAPMSPVTFQAGT